jgi:hypothetical protein
MAVGDNRVPLNQEPARAGPTLCEDFRGFSGAYSFDPHVHDCLDGTVEALQSEICWHSNASPYRRSYFLEEETELKQLFGRPHSLR